MPRSSLRRLVFPLFLFVLLMAACVLYVESLLQRPSVQQYLLKELSAATGYELHAQDLQILFGQGIGIQGNRFRLHDSQGEEWLTANQVQVYLNPGRLLRGQILPTRIHLQGPEFQWANHAASGPVTGPFHLGPALVQKLALIPSLFVDGGSLILQGFPFEMQDLHIHVARPDPASPVMDLSLGGSLLYRDLPMPFRIKGKVQLHKEMSPSLDLSVEAREIPLTAFPWPSDLPFEKGMGRMTGQVTLSQEGVLSVKGVADLDQVQFSIVDQQQRKPYHFDTLSIPFTARYAQSVLAVSTFEMNGPGFLLTGSATMDFQQTGNPSLHLQVESPPMDLATFYRLFPSSLVPAWLETDLFPIFSGGKVSVNPFSLSGSLHQIRYLERPENAHCLTLALQCTGLTAFQEEQGLPVAASGRVDVSGGRLDIRGAALRFGESEIHEGHLTVSNLYGDEADYRVSLAGSLRVEDLFRQAGLPVVPSGVRQRLQILGPAKGELEADIHFVREAGRSGPVGGLYGEVNFKDCTFHPARLVLPVTISIGHLHLEDSGEGRFQGTGQWGGSLVKTTGTFGALGQQARAQIEGEMDLKEVLETFHPRSGSLLRFEGKTPFALSLDKEAKVWVFGGTADGRHAVLESAILTIDPFKQNGQMSFSGRYDPKKGLNIDHLVFPVGQAALSLSGSMDLPEKNQLRFRIAAHDLLFQDLGLQYHPRDIQAQGMLTCDLDIVLSPSHLDATEIHGRLQAHELVFASPQLPWPLEVGHADLVLDGKQLHIEDLLFQMGHSLFQISGQLHGWTGLKGEIQAQSEVLDISDLLPAAALAPSLSLPPRKGFEETLEKPESPSFLGQIDVAFFLKATKVLWEGMDFSPMEAKGTWKTGNLQMERASLHFPSGMIHLAGHVDWGSRPEMDILVSSYLKLMRQPLQELPLALDFLHDRMTGHLTLEGLFYFQGSGKQEMLASLTGNANILLEKGVIHKSNLFIKILDFLSIRGIFRDKNQGKRGQGLPYDAIQGNLAMQNGMVETSDLVLRGPTLNAIASGKVDLSREILDVNIGIQPLVTTDAILSRIPIVGYLLTGDKKSLYIEYFHASGPLWDPEVSYLPFKSVGRSTVGLVQRLLLSPNRLYRDMRETARDFEARGIPVPEGGPRPDNDMGP